jgi:hypothetical protein
MTGNHNSRNWAANLNSREALPYSAWNVMKWEELARKQLARELLLIMPSGWWVRRNYDAGPTMTATSAGTCNEKIHSPPCDLQPMSKFPYCPQQLNRFQFRCMASAKQPFVGPNLPLLATTHSPFHFRILFCSNNFFPKSFKIVHKQPQFKALCDEFIIISTPTIVFWSTQLVLRKNMLV